MAPTECEAAGGSFHWVALARILVVLTEYSCGKFCFTFVGVIIFYAYESQELAVVLKEGFGRPGPRK